MRIDVLGRLGTAAARYGLIGLGCATLNVGIVHVGHSVLHAPYILAAVATCLITIPISYFAHRRISFAQMGPGNGAEFLRFSMQQLSQFALGLLLLIALVEILVLHPTAAMLMVSVLMFAYGFITNASWVFRFARRR